jgi:hypothetical protein
MHRGNIPGPNQDRKTTRFFNFHSPVVEEDEVSVLVGGLGRLGNNTRVEGALLLMILSYRKDNKIKMKTQVAIRNHKAKNGN